MARVNNKHFCCLIKCYLALIECFHRVSEQSSQESREDLMVEHFQRCFQANVENVVNEFETNDLEKCSSLVISLWYGRLKNIFLILSHY